MYRLHLVVWGTGTTSKRGTMCCQPNQQGMLSHGANAASTCCSLYHHGFEWICHQALVGHLGLGNGAGMVKHCWKAQLSGLQQYLCFHRIVWRVSGDNISVKWTPTPAYSFFMAVEAAWRGLGAAGALRDCTSAAAAKPTGMIFLCIHRCSSRTDVLA